MSEEEMWAIAVPNYRDVGNHKQHRILTPQLHTVQVALCGFDPGIHFWNELPPSGMREYPLCYECLKAMNAPR